MSKKKKSKKLRKKGLSNSKLSNLILEFFRENLGGKFNYKQISNALKVKETGARIQIISVMNELSELGVLEEVRRGSYRLVEKSTKAIGTIKNSNKRGAYAEINEAEEVFIPKEKAQFSLSGDNILKALEKCIMLDLYKMPGGSFSRCSLEHIGVYLLCERAKRDFLIYGPRSSANSLHHALIQASISA